MPDAAQSPARGPGEAPGLFEALALEPIPPGVERSPLGPDSVAAGPGGREGGVPGFVDDEEVTNPRARVPEPPPPPRPPPSPVLAPAVTAAGGVDPLADPFVEAEPVAAPRRSIPWGWATMTVVMAGALGYVLYTETDLFEPGDLIARRDAQAVAEVKAAVAEAKAEQKAKGKEYGSIQLNSNPDGARVWMLRDGPTATFHGLPRAHEFQVLVEAPGHLPRIRTVKGTELTGPVVLDLNPADDPDAVSPLPDVPAPEVADAYDEKDTVDLVVETHTPDAQLGLLVGFTPGMTMMDLEVTETHHFRITLPGHRSHDVVLKGRHWEEGPDGALVYLETVTLEPRQEEELLAIEPEAAEPAPAPRKKKRGKRRRRKRGKKR